MIRNLRKRFTIVAMGSMFAVLATIMTIFNILNYVRFVDDADNTLRMIAENDGKFPSPPSMQSERKKGEGAPDPELEKKQGASEPEPGKRPEDPREKRNPQIGEQEGMSPEAPYLTRYFSVRMDKTGNVISSDLQNIAAVTEEEAKRYAKVVFASQKTKGFQDIYRYTSVQEDDGIIVIFLDSRQELESFRTNLLTSLVVSAAGLLAVFVLVLIFSGIVFRPVAEGYEKQRQFITDASHEIKTPLTIIDANIEVIEMEHGGDEWTKSVRKQVQRLADFTRQLIALTKLDEEGLWKHKTEFSLTNAIKESIQPFEVFAKTCGKTVETDVQEQITMLGDEKSIRQLISILMDNAVKYSLAESTIYVSLEKKGRKMQFEVYNETYDVPEGNLDILFERFYRLDASRNSETGGSGIGLSVARAIVESHQGKIRAHSDDGKSIRVSVEFR